MTDKIPTSTATTGTTNGASNINSGNDSPVKAANISQSPERPTSKGERLKLTIPSNTNSDADNFTNNNLSSTSSNAENLIKHRKNATVVAKVKPKKKRDKSDLGDDFIAPDGGWGWLVSMANGIATLVTFAIGQNFGILFRSHLSHLGIIGSELTSIINTQIAVSAFTGLLNGPMFRKFTFRQVALVGSFLTFLGIFIAAFADSYGLYVLGFGCVYGFGRGIVVSAGSLAVNTYFKVKRRMATAYCFGVAGLGPIFLPYLATFLIQYYGVTGTVMIFSAMSLHTVACSLIYQPVKWHVKKLPPDEEAATKPLTPVKKKDEEIPNVVEPDTPTLPRSNDGWYSSKSSLSSTRSRLGSLERTPEGDIQLQELRKINRRDSNSLRKQRTFSKSHSIKEEDEDDEKHQERQALRQKEKEEKDVALLETKAELEEQEAENERRKRLPFYKKIVIFFDLDLLKDITYCNLAFGLTLINFVEINFAFLTPFILSDFGFANNQIAMAMSLLGFCDLVIRFLVPMITGRFSLSNKGFFIVGILGMCLGRIILTFTRNFYLLLVVFAWLGLNKAFRTVFWQLIIPSYVPLKRLPAAAGLQLLMSGTFSMSCGPLIGLIRDHTNFEFTLHFLNSLCFVAIFFWLLEPFIRNRIGKPVNTGE